MLMRPARGSSFLSSIWADAVLTLTLSPFALLAIALAAFVTLVAPGAETLPIVFAALAIIISDVVTRDVRAATTAIIHSTPRLRERLVWWKLGSTLVLAVLLCVVPLVRSAVHGLHTFTPLLVGVFFAAAMATSLGVVAGNSKAFIATFLSFWYLVVNDRGATPLLDFAGFYGTASRQTILLYLALGVAGLAAAETFHRARLRQA